VSSLRVSSPNVVVRRHALAGKLTLAAFAVFAAGFALGVAFSTLGAAALASAGAMVAMLLAARRVARGVDASEGFLTLADHAIVVERVRGREEMARTAITAGWVVPGVDGATVVELQHANGDVIAAEVSSLDEGNQLLAAAGIDVRRRAVRVVLGGRWDSLGYGIATLLFMLLQGAPVFVLMAIALRLSPPVSAALALGILALSSVMGGRALGPGVITIGADGVSWRRGFSRGYFSWRELAEVDLWHGNEVMLRSHRGERVLLSFSRRDPTRAVGVIELIRAAMVRAQSHVAANLDALDRGGRDLAEWTDAVRALLKGSAYRGAGIDRDAIEQALGDPESSPERRVGAALALTADGSPDSRTRVRVAAEACVDEPLREALIDVANGELDEGSIEAITRMQTGR
jgi:hypothetical protein